MSNGQAQLNSDNIFSAVQSEPDYTYLMECMMRCKRDNFDFYDDFEYKLFDNKKMAAFPDRDIPCGFASPKNQRAKEELAYLLFFTAYQQLSDKRTISKVYNFYCQHATDYREDILKQASEIIHVLYNNPYLDTGKVSVQQFANALIISQLYLHGEFHFLQSLPISEYSDIGPAWGKLYAYITSCIIYDDEILTEFLFLVSYLAHIHEYEFSYEPNCREVLNEAKKDMKKDEIYDGFFRSTLCQYINRHMIQASKTPLNAQLVNTRDITMFWVNQKLLNNKPTGLQSPRYCEYLYAAGTIQVYQYRIRDIILAALPNYLDVTQVEVKVPDEQAQLQLRKKDDEIASLKEQLEKKQNVINRLDKENAKLKALTSEKSSEVENAPVEEAIQDIPAPVTPVIEPEVDVNDLVESIKDKKYVMVGGYDKGQGIIQYLPHIRFVEAGNRNAPKFDMRRYDMLLVRSNCVKHSTTNRYISMARSTRTPILYIGENTERSVKQIYEAFQHVE